MLDQMFRNPKYFVCQYYQSKKKMPSSRLYLSTVRAFFKRLARFVLVIRNGYGYYLCISSVSGCRGQSLLRVIIVVYVKRKPKPWCAHRELITGDQRVALVERSAG